MNSTSEKSSSMGGVAINRPLAVLFLGSAIAFMAAFFIGPMLLVVQSSLDSTSGSSIDNYRRVLGDEFYWFVLINTLRMAGWVTLLTLIMGYTLSYYMVFHVKSALVRRIIYIIVLLPLFTSNIVRSFGWIVILGREGVINQWLISLGILDAPLRLLYTTGSVNITLAYVMLPFMVLSINSIFQNLNPALMEASRDLGAGTLVTFLKVTLPLSLPGVIAGSLIVFTLSVSAYVTPSIMSGGRSIVMSMLIYDNYMVDFNFSMGATLSVMLLLTSFIIIGVYLFILKQHGRD